MYSILNELCKAEKYAAFYTNSNDTTRFIYARIVSIGENDITFELLSPDGGFDGIVAKQIDDILRIEVDGQYAEKMQKLLSYDKIHSNDYNIDADCIKGSLLLSAKKLKKIVTIEILKSELNDITGFVERVQDGLCTIKQVDEYGYEDGITYVELQNITEISCDSKDESRILKLWEKTNSVQI